MSDPIKTEYVLGFFFYGGSVLLVKKAKPDWQKGLFNGVGGKVETFHLAGVPCREEPIVSMVREFKEETGVDTKQKDWTHVLEMTGNDWHVTVFAMEATGPVNDNGGTAEEPVYWFTRHSLPMNMISNLPWLIPMCWDKLRGKLDYKIEG